MKKRPGIRPWIRKTKPNILAPINIILETKEDDYRIFTDNASLYQGILRYARDYSNDEIGFLFTDMAHWLIKTLPEFVNFYTGNKAKTTKSARLENRRDRIEEYIKQLINMEFIKIKKYISAKKNQKEKIPIFYLTMEGKFLSYLLDAKSLNKTPDLRWMIKHRFEDTSVGEDNNNKIIDEKRSRAIEKIFEIIKKYFHFKESYILSFLYKFLKRCFDNNLFGDIIDMFYYICLRQIKVNKGQELLRLFTKVNHPLHWMFVYPNLFMKALNELDNETRKMIFFKFKMEIEEYYDLYYLASYPRRQTYSELHSSDSYYEYNMAIAGKEWQSLRFANIHNHLIVTIPGRCLECKSESPFVMDIYNYLDNLKEFSNGDLHRENIHSACAKCKINSVIGKIYIPLDMIRGHEIM